MVSLTIEQRTSGKKQNSALRKAGKLPAVLYGPKEDAASVAVDLRSFEKVLKQAGESTVVELEGMGDKKQALIHEIDHDPVTGTPRHVDFYIIEKGQKVEVTVPIVFEGESPAVKAGGVLVKVLHELEVEAEAANLPHELTAHLVNLASIGDQLTASDIKLPAGVTLITNPEEVVATVSEQKEEVESAPIDLASIEVEEKGKKEEPAEEAAAE